MGSGVSRFSQPQRYDTMRPRQYNYGGRPHFYGGRISAARDFPRISLIPSGLQRCGQECEFSVFRKNEGPGRAPRCIHP